MFALIALLLLGAPQFHALPLDSLGITATPSTRWYSYTNKESGFYFGEIHGGNFAPFQGWTVYDNPVLKDYSLEVNGTELDRGGSSVTVFPDRIVRVYASGVTETFTLLDNVNAFVVRLQSPKKVDIRFRLLFNSTNASDFVLSGKQMGLLENKSLPAGNFGKWIAVSASGMESSYQPRMQGSFASPAVFKMIGKDVSMTVACGKNDVDARRTALNVLRNRGRLESERRKRMQDILDRSYVSTGRPKFDKALAWAKLSLDALVTNQGMRGIWAGLPWFNDYWGRDSFISLAGATIWLGNFKAAREILLDFAAKQDTDGASAYYGRIPNLITPKETIYNTVDGTPRFVNAAWRYYTSTGDSSFLRQVYPVVKRSFEGAVLHHVDKDGFLTHGDQETWMDAVGPNGPYVRRGNRAVDVQALWFRQLTATESFARIVGDSAVAGWTRQIASLLRTSFNDKFIDRKTGLLYDHLSPDGVPDTTLRPNQIFALDLVNNRSIKARILKSLTEELDYPWGVASLCQSDPDFHPFHHNEPYYVPDAAYHNGTVWVWLTGPLVSALTEMREQDFAFKNTMFLADEILDGKTAGTLPELFDAFPREDESKPDESGAFSQAWSLAEFIRSFYEDYLGVRVDAGNHSVSLRPMIPSMLKDITFRLNGGKCGDYLITYRFVKELGEIEISPLDFSGNTLFRVYSPHGGGKEVESDFSISGKGKVILRILPDSIEASEAGAPLHLETISEPLVHFASLDSLHFQTPRISLEWKYAKQPDFKVLGLSDIKKKDADAILFAGADDPTGDDRGPAGTYTYPLNQNFRQGILDITHASVSYDSSDIFFTLRFRNLVNPMWHPDYGFQLTFAAIAIGNGSGGDRELGRNSDYTLPAGRGFQKVIYVGGGLEIFDSSGTKLAAYVPVVSDTSNTLGSTADREIEFSIPVSILGRPDSDWQISILVGAQDDHGGGGVGEFRSILHKATEWQGGGKEEAGEPNIYDEMFLKQ
jgi:glycogen debranching enzyme